MWQFGPTECGVQPHGNDEIPHMNRFYSGSVPGQRGYLAERDFGINKHGGRVRRQARCY